MLYTQQDGIDSARAFKRSALFIGAVSAPFVAAIVALALLRQKTPTMVVTALWGCALVMWWGMRGRWLHGYSRFVRELLQGRSREQVLLFQGVEPADSLRDCVRMRGLEFAVQGQSFPLVLYWDAQRPLPDWQAGQRVRVRSHEYVIIDAAPA
ncbi:MAG: hypothetical protein ACOYJA_13315 [Christensenellales bacterium]|jgi:hypothetical protein